MRSINSVTILLFSSFLLSQTKPIEGLVVNEIGMHLASVNVVSHPSRTGTQSNKEGEFSFIIPVKDRKLSFNHVGYIPDTVNAILFKNGTTIILKEKVLEMDSLDVTAASRTQFDPFEEKNSVIHLDMEELSLRGFMDVGDALFSEQSILLNETMTGQKTASVRASTAEELVFLYDGVRINTMGDPLLDLSMFSTTGLSGMELVKGGHEKALSSSGTINFIPKMSYGNSALFNQQFGTYNYGSYNGFGSLGFKYATLNSGMGEGQFSQVYSDTSAPEIHTHHQRIFVNTGFRNGKNLEIRFMGLQNAKTFKNNRTSDSVDVSMENIIVKLNHVHPLGGSITLYVLYQQYRGYEATTIASRNKKDTNRGFGFEFEKDIKHATIRIANESSYPASDWDVDTLPVFIRRQNSTFTGSFEIYQPEEDKKFQLKDVKVVFSKHRVSDVPDTSFGIYMPHNFWNLTNSLFTASVLNKQPDKRILMYANMGNVFRVPSLGEIIANQTQTLISGLSDIVPEHKSTYELGFKMKNVVQESERSYSMTISWFRYHYTDKIKQFQLSGAPVQFPFNIGEARLSGFDSHLVFKPRRKWIHYTSTFSYYYFSDPMAFQLQPERMIRNTISIHNKWFNLDLIHRGESSRQITTVKSSGAIKPNFLEPITNYDINLSTDIQYRHLKGILSLSGRNLNNTAQQLDGVSIYDRRYTVKLTLAYK